MARFVSVAAFALAITAGFGGCFNVDKPTCSYSCSDTTPACPDDYECRSDGYCHLTGTTAECSFSDAAVPIDMAVPGNDLLSTSN